MIGSPDPPKKRRHLKFCDIFAPTIFGQEDIFVNNLKKTQMLADVFALKWYEARRSKK